MLTSLVILVVNFQLSNNQVETRRLSTHLATRLSGNGPMWLAWQFYSAISQDGHVYGQTAGRATVVTISG